MYLMSEKQIIDLLKKKTDSKTLKYFSDVLILLAISQQKIKNIDLYSFKTITKKFNFVITKEVKYEEDFIKLIKSIEYIDIRINDNLKENEINITLDPKLYFQNLKDKKIDLFIISVDHDNSFFLNSIKYLKTNNINKLKYNESYFKNFLIKSFPLRTTKWKLIKFLNYFKISIRKNFIFKKIWYPKFFFKQHLYNGKLFGKGDYNCYLQRSKSFDKDFNYVSENLSNEKSKKIIMILFMADPQKSGKNYFNNLTGEEHYQHH